MKEVFDKIIGFIHSEIARTTSYAEHDTQINIKFFVEQLRDEYNNGWIPCSRELPPQPKENPLFGNKPLELYLVSLNSTDYPWRAFWNGKYFTDGWSKITPIAWQPLPAPYQPKGE